MGSLGTPNDIHVVFIAMPWYGHVRPFRSLAKHLASFGYRHMTFITGETWRGKVEQLEGVEFVPLTGIANFDPENMDETFPERAEQPQDARKTLWEMEHIFVGSLRDQSEVLQSVLSRPELQHKQVVVVSDVGATGTLPITLRSPKVRHVPMITLGHSMLFTLSKDVAPFGMGLPPQGEEKNQELNAVATQMFAGVSAAAREILRPYDCREPLRHELVLEAMVYTADLFLQLCVPALEYPRSDIPGNLRFVGAILGGNDDKGQPEWFDSFVKQPDERPLVVVTSGTVDDDSHHLIIPTIEACRHLPVRLVVCTVQATLPDDFEIPENVRVASWIPFDKLFEYTSIVVSSGGYGGITQAFAAGIPMIVAGTTEDKTETTGRAEMTGAAINLKIQSPSMEQVKGALEKMMKDKSYKASALELKKAYTSYDTIGLIESAIREMANKFAADAK